MTRPACILLAIIVPALCAASEPEVVRRVLSEPERRAAHSSLHFPFGARSDRRLISARVDLEWAPDPGAAEYELRLNGRRIGMVAGRDRTSSVELDPALLSDRDDLSLNVRSDPHTCLAPAGAWAPLVAVTITTSSAPAPWPSDLALLPLPFVDPDYEREATVAVVFPQAPGLDEVRIAGHVATWLGREGGAAVRFQVSWGRLPTERALVLVNGAEAAKALGLAAPTGPALRWEGQGGRLLVLEGRDQSELESAALQLVAGAPLSGARVDFSESPPALGETRKYGAPRWLVTDVPVPFSRYPGAPRLTLAGTDGTLRVPFRIPPDLWAWPREAIEADVGWSASPGTRIDVSLNGESIGTLPEADARGARTRLWLPATALRGFNELRFDVQRQGSACRESDPNARVTISGDSVIHFEGLPHYDEQPDVGVFAYDGFPFSRRPDLAETAIVLPRKPSAAQVGTALSVLAQLASITGGGGERAILVSPELVAAAADRDLLVIGAPSEQPLISRWAPRWPAAWQGSALEPRRVATGSAALDLIDPAVEAEDEARSVAARSSSLAVITGIVSPLRADRVAILVTSAGDAPLPQAPDWLGYMKARVPGGDLLLMAGEQRWLFRLGPTHGVGTLGAFTRTRWEVAQRWYLLVPAFLLGGLLAALGARGRLEQRMRRRLAEGDEQ